MHSNLLRYLRGLATIALAALAANAYSHDFDGDGFGDILVRDPIVAGPGEADGSVFVVSKATSTVLLEIPSPYERGLFGFDAWIWPDLTGDNEPEIAVLAPMAFADSSAIGRVAVFDGVDGSLIYELAGPVGSILYWDPAPTFDFNADGVADILISALIEDDAGLLQESWLLFCGASGRSLGSGTAPEVVMSRSTQSPLGTAVRMPTADMNGDKVVDFQDIAAIGSQVGQQVEPASEGDLNVSGEIDASDFQSAIGAIGATVDPLDPQYFETESPTPVGAPTIAGRINNLICFYIWRLFDHFHPIPYGGRPGRAATGNGYWWIICFNLPDPSCTNPDEDGLEYDELVAQAAMEEVVHIGGGVCEWTISRGAHLIDSFWVSPDQSTFYYTTVPDDTGTIVITARFDDGCGCIRRVSAAITVDDCLDIDVVGPSDVQFGDGGSLQASPVPPGALLDWQIVSGENLLSSYSTTANSFVFTAGGVSGTVAIKASVADAVQDCVSEDTHLLVIRSHNPSDSDGDGIGDDCEDLFGSDALDPLAMGPNTDSDNDGLEDIWECEIRSDATIADTDGDGLYDGFEVYESHTDPLSPDSDGNGVPDGDEDPDGDGLPNAGEQGAGADPNNADSDNDGTSDGDELANGSDPIDAGDGGDAPDPGGTVLYQVRLKRNDSASSTDPLGYQTSKAELRIGNELFFCGPGEEVFADVVIPRGTIVGVTWRMIGVDRRGDAFDRLHLDELEITTSDPSSTSSLVLGNNLDRPPEGGSAGSFNRLLFVDPLDTRSPDYEADREYLHGGSTSVRIRWQNLPSIYVSPGFDEPFYLALHGVHDLTIATRYYDSVGNPIGSPYANMLYNPDRDMGGVLAEWEHGLPVLGQHWQWAWPTIDDQFPCPQAGWVDVTVIKNWHDVSTGSDETLTFLARDQSWRWFHSDLNFNRDGQLRVSYAGTPTFVPTIQSPPGETLQGIAGLMKGAVPSDVIAAATPHARFRPIDLVIELTDSAGLPMPGVPVRVISRQGYLAVTGAGGRAGPGPRSPVVYTTNEHGRVDLVVEVDLGVFPAQEVNTSAVFEDLFVLTGPTAEQQIPELDSVEDDFVAVKLSQRTFRGNHVELSPDPRTSNWGTIYFSEGEGLYSDDEFFVPATSIQMPIINDIDLLILEDNLEGQRYVMHDQPDFSGSFLSLYDASGDLFEEPWPEDYPSLLAYDDGSWINDSNLIWMVQEGLADAIGSLHGQGTSIYDFGGYGQSLREEWVYSSDFSLDHLAQPDDPWYESRPITVAAVAGEFALGFVPGYDLKDVVVYGIFKNIDDDGVQGHNYLIAAASLVGLAADAGYLAGPTGLATNAVASGLKVMIRHVDPQLIRTLFRIAGNARQSAQALAEYIFKLPKPDNFAWTNAGLVKDWVLDVTVGNINRWNGYLRDTVIVTSRQDVADSIKIINTHTVNRAFREEGEAAAVAITARHGKQVTEDMAVRLKNSAGAGTDAADASLDNAFSALGKARDVEPASAIARIDDTVQAVLHTTRNGPNWSQVENFVGPNMAIKSLDEFEALRRLPAESLTDAQRATINAIRDAIPMPTQGAPIQKLIALDDTAFNPAAMIQTGNSQISGFIGRAQDFPAGSPSAGQLIDRYRLDYQTSGFAPNHPYAVLETKVSPDMASGLNVPRDPALGNYPNTANGFTASRDGTLTPEWHVDGARQMPAGDEFGVPVTVMRFKHADGSPYVRTIEIDGVPVSSSDWKLISDVSSPTGYRWEPY